jgi:ABC-type branched-subunit amino acid transport system substrate-binding protein
VRTFARVVPTDASQAVALLAIQRTIGCHTTFILHDGEFDGFDAALSYAQSAGLRVAGTLPFTRQAPSYSSLVKTVAGSGANCVLISAIDERSSVLLTEQLASAVPAATIFVGNGLANNAYLDAVPHSLDSRLIVLSATLPPKDYAASARGFAARYEQRFGTSEPSAIFGYAAMELTLDVIDDATSGGRKQADRAKLLAALFDGDQRRTILGMIHISRTGDMTVHRFGIYRVAGGRLSFIEAVG